ncbi:MAG: ABC transporter permease, partial [Blastocatellia bacterium]
MGGLWKNARRVARWKNLRQVARTLTQQPEFTLIAVFALGLGIGANTAIFSVVHALLPKPLSLPAPDRVVAISSRSEVVAANYPDWQAQSQSYEHLAIYRGWIANLTGIEEPERVQGYLITA